MSLEIEKKYRIDADQLSHVVAELKDYGAEYLGEDFEENIIYGGNALDEKGAILRIRTTQDRALLTYKQRVQNDLPVKQQVEHESEFADVGSVKEIVRCLGLEPRIIYEKRRRTWKLRDVEIVLDELPFGLYMEIEGAITAIREAEMLLGIEEFEAEHETYPRLTARLGTVRNGIVESRFHA